MIISIEIGDFLSHSETKIDFEKGVEFYRNQNFQEAIILFKATLSIYI